MAKKKGPVLYELLRKDHAEKRWPNQAEPPQAAPAAPKSQEPSTGDLASRPSASRMDAQEEDGETLVFHLTRAQVAIVAGGIIVALLVFAWIGNRASKSAGPVEERQPVTQTADTAVAPARDEPQEPLAMLLPEPGSDPGPDQPVKVTHAGEPATAPAAGEDARSATTAKAGGDSRRPGLNYLVIQIIPDRPDAEEHTAAVRKFLMDKGIRTIAVPGDNGGTMIMSEQGFNWDDPGDRARLEKMTEAVKKAGKEYASAKNAGRYDFRAPFAKKYKG